MHIAAYLQTVDLTLPGIRLLRDTLAAKSDAFKSIVKTGRTHFMDATPLTLGQEFGGYVQQLNNGIRAIENALEMVAYQKPVAERYVATTRSTAPSVELIVGTVPPGHLNPVGHARVAAVPELGCVMNKLIVCPSKSTVLVILNVLTLTALTRLIANTLEVLVLIARVEVLAVILVDGVYAAPVATRLAASPAVMTGITIPPPAASVTTALLLTMSLSPLPVVVPN
jgi:hypothetical protein